MCVTAAGVPAQNMKFANTKIKQFLFTEQYTKLLVIRKIYFPWEEVNFAVSGPYSIWVAFATNRKI